ncbi:MAG: pitrilysin family protein, partial [Bacteroidota bacterium]
MTQKFISFLAIVLLLGLIGCKGSKNLASSKTDMTENTEVAAKQESSMNTTATKGTTAASGASTISSDPLPFDPETRVGKLDNGLTYYIRKNAKPENFAEFRLAVNAGSILEDEDQQGLAHFLEHMAFNGTKNFPKSDLVDYLESIGTKFGAHLNAYTSFDETVYMLKIPTDDPEKFDKGLQIMEDWAHNIVLEPEEIEKERGVVISEWRTRLGAGERIQKKTIPKTFYNSRYPDRLPIGKPEIVENFTPDVLQRFYKDWYRPDLMAVVIVGDIDVDKVEAQIKEKFNRIAKAESPRERPVYGIPDHDETLVAIASDEEFPYNVVSFMYKQEHKQVKDM